MNKLEAQTATDTRTLIADMYQAIADRTPVTITYTAADGTATLRTIEPYNLTVADTGEILIKAMDRLRGEGRSFRVDRVQTYVVHTDVPFELPVEFTMDEPVQDRVSGRAGRVLVPGGTRVFVLWSDGTEEIVESASISPLPRHVDAPPSAYFDRAARVVQVIVSGNTGEPLSPETIVEPSHTERDRGAPVADWSRGGRAKTAYHRSSGTRALCDRRIRTSLGTEPRTRAELTGVLPVCEKCDAL